MPTTLNALILFLTVVAALVAASVLPFRSPQTIRISLTFSGAYLLAVAVFELLPEVYGGEQDEHIGLWVLAGYILQLFLELFSGGVEHGHDHVHLERKRHMPWGLLLALFAHALLESMPIGALGAGETANRLTIAIALHSFPITLVLYGILRGLELPKGKVWAAGLLFALMPVTGIIMADSLAVLSQSESQLTALTLGVFLHVSTTILFESARGHSFNMVKFGSAILAFLTAYFLHELI